MTSRWVSSAELGALESLLYPPQGQPPTPVSLINNKGSRIMISFSTSQPLFDPDSNFYSNLQDFPLSYRVAHARSGSSRVAKRLVGSTTTDCCCGTRLHKYKYTHAVLYILAKLVYSPLYSPPRIDTIYWGDSFKLHKLTYQTDLDLEFHR